MADNDFRNTVETLFRGMDNFITSKTVVGDAVNVGNDTVIVPLVDVSFGVGAGAFAGDKRDNGEDAERGERSCDPPPQPPAGGGIDFFLFRHDANIIPNPYL